MKILVRVPNWIGDSVLSIPALHALSTSGRNSVTVVAHERVKDIFEGLEGVDRVVPFKEGFLLWIGLRKERFDLGVLFPFSFSSAFLLALSGTKERIGYQTEGRRLFLTHSLQLPKDYRRHHLVETYFNIVRSLDGNSAISVHPELDSGSAIGIPQIPISPLDEASAERFLTTHSLIHSPTYIGIGPEVAYGPAKEWRRFPELVKRLLDHGTVVILGISNHQSPITNHQSPVVDLRGKTTLKETAAILKRLRIFITNDTGLGHLASAVGTPVLSIFGSTSPEWTKPIGNRNRVLYKNLWCSPCFKRTCRFGTYACLEEISVNSVMEVVEEMLSHEKE